MLREGSSDISLAAESMALPLFKAAVELESTAGSANIRSPMKMIGWPPTTSMRAAALLFEFVCEDMMLPELTRKPGGLKVLSGKREVPSGGRSLGTTLPPAVTRMPGGLPCSLRSFSALPRLIDGVGDGLLKGTDGASGSATGSRRLVPDDLAARFADADAEGRRTCSVYMDWSVLELLLARGEYEGLCIENSGEDVAL